MGAIKNWKLYISRLLTAAVYILIFKASAQQQSDFRTLYKKVSENIIYDHSNINNILNYLNSKANGPEEVAQVAVMYSDYYYSRGEYDKSVEYIFHAGENYHTINDSLKLGIVLRKQRLAYNLTLQSQFEDYKNIADEIIKKHNKTWCTGLQLKADFEKAYILISKNNLKAADSLLNVTNTRFGPVVLDNNNLYAEYTILRALAAPGSGHPDILKALDRYKSVKSYNRFHKAMLMVLLSDQLRQSNNYSKAISLLLDAENETAIFQNPYIESNIYERLSTYFSGTITPEVQKGYNEKFLLAYNKIQENEITALNSFYKLYKGDLETAYSTSVATQYVYYYILTALFVLILIVWYAIYVYKTLRMRKLKEIISYLEIPNRLLEKKPLALQSEKDKDKFREKKITMSDETERMILEKLKVFEQSGKFINPAMSLAMLAGETEINTKYLSEVINKHYNDNYNTYINKLRVNYIIEKLKNDPNYLNYKISYLAEESGFASHSSFTTVFRNIAGISPTEFINVISKQTQQKA